MKRMISGTILPEAILARIARRVGFQEPYKSAIEDFFKKCTKTLIRDMGRFELGSIGSHFGLRIHRLVT